MIYGIDISHHQDDGAPINWQLLNGHVDFVISKLTEGVGYVDPTAAAHIAGARSIGAIPGVYHFARSNDPILEAGYFVAHAPDLTGAFVALDSETGQTPSWCLAWLNSVAQQIGFKPLVYLNKSTITGQDWSHVVNAGYGLWEANYDGNATDFSVTGEWPCVAIKQYTDSANVPGISGGVDADSFNGTRAQLLSYCKPGTPTPVPTPTPSPPPVAPWNALPSLAYGMMHNGSVESLQRFLAHSFPVYGATHGTLDPTGNYLTVTAAWVKEFQTRTGIVSGDGRNIGPQTKAKLWSFGWRG